MANVWTEYACFCRYFVSLSQVRYEHSYQKYPEPLWVRDIFIAVTVARTHLNASVRWTLACRRLDGGNTLIFCHRQKMQIESGHWHHVGASFVSLAPTFFKSQSALTPLLLLFRRDPLALGSRLMMRTVRI